MRGRERERKREGMRQMAERGEGEMGTTSSTRARNQTERTQVIWVCLKAEECSHFVPLVMLQEVCMQVECRMQFCDWLEL